MLVLSQRVYRMKQQVLRYIHIHEQIKKTDKFSIKNAVEATGETFLET